MTTEITQTDGRRFEYYDLKEATYKANNKFEVVALSSIALSVLTLDGDSSFLGISFKDISEPMVEAVFLLASIFLFINFLLRLRDEGKIFSNLNSNVEELKQLFASKLEEIEALRAKLRSVASIGSINSDLAEAQARLDDIKLDKLDPLIKDIERFSLQYDEHKRRSDALRNLSAEQDPHGLATSDASEQESMADIVRNDISGMTGQLAKYVNEVGQFSAKLQNVHIFSGTAAKELNLTTPTVDKLSNAINRIEEVVGNFSVAIVQEDVRPINAARRIKWFLIWWPRTLLALVCLAYLYSLSNHLNWYSYPASMP